MADNVERITEALLVNQDKKMSEMVLLLQNILLELNGIEPQEIKDVDIQPMTEKLEAILQEVKKKSEEEIEIEIDEQTRQKLKGEDGKDADEDKIVERVTKRIVLPDPSRIATQVLAQIPIPENGKDADEEVIIQKVIENITLPNEESAEETRDKLESLEGDARLDASAIKNLRKHNDFIQYIGRVKNFLSLDDTPSEYTGQAGKAVVVKSGEDGLEFSTVNADDEKVKISSNDTTADYLDSKLADSAEIEFTENNDGSNETLSPSIVVGSIDETKLDASVNASLDLADSALQSGDNVSELVNDAGYSTVPGHTIRENGVDQTTRTGLNFVDTDAGADLITDDSGDDETEVNLDLYLLKKGRTGGQEVNGDVSVLPDDTNFPMEKTGDITTTANANDIFASGNFVYTTGINKLEIFYRNDDGTTTILGTTSTSISNPQSLFINGDVAYVLNSGNRLLLSFDIADKSNPTLISSVPVNSSYTSGRIALRGGNIFIPLSGAQAFETFDVSDPTNMVSLGNTTTTYTSPVSIAVQGNRLAIALGGSSGRIELFDISDVNNITSLGTFFSLNVQDLAFQGIYLHTVGTSQTYKILDVSDPANISQVSSTFFPYVLKSLSLAGRYTVIGTTGAASIRRYVLMDTEDPTAPVELADISSSFNVNRIVNAGGTFYGQQFGSKSVNILEPHGFLEIGGSIIHSLEAGLLNVRKDVNIAGDQNVIGTILNGNGMISLGSISASNFLKSGEVIQTLDRAVINNGSVITHNSQIVYI